MVKACSNTHTETLSKDWKTYWFKAFKEISNYQVATKLTKQRLCWSHTTDTGFTELVRKVTKRIKSNKDNKQ